MSDDRPRPRQEAGTDSGLDLVATNVAVVTTVHEGRPHGLTANVWGEAGNGGVCLITVRRGSNSWEAITGSGRFAANVLRAEQVGVARRFARREPEPGRRFAGVRHEERDGWPVLAGCLVTLLCEIEGCFPFGMQDVVTGRVTGTVLGAPGVPLLFHHGGFRTTKDLPSGTAPSY